MPYSYTGASYTYIPDNTSGGIQVLYPLTTAGGTTTDDKQSALVGATRVNIMAVIVTKVGTGTMSIAVGGAAVLAITPSVAGPVDLGPIGMEVAGGWRISCPTGSTNNLLIIWEKIS